jgi:hypothetical protein
MDPTVVLALVTPHIITAVRPLGSAVPSRAENTARL